MGQSNTPKLTGYFKDRTGERFGSIIATSPAFKDKIGRFHWNGRCDCGKEVVFNPSGPKMSCGCGLGDGRFVHAKARRDDRRSKLYSTWTSIGTRCNNPNVKHWKHYGGKGVKRAPIWDDFGVFERDMLALGWTQELTVDRINYDGNYEPGNVKVSTNYQQARNRTDNHWLEHEGKRQCVSDWSVEKNISVALIIARLNRLGWSIQKTLDTPPHKKFRPDGRWPAEKTG